VLAFPGGHGPRCGLRPAAGADPCTAIPTRLGPPQAPLAGLYSPWRNKTRCAVAASEEAAPVACRRAPARALRFTVDTTIDVGLFADAADVPEEHMP